MTTTTSTTTTFQVQNQTVLVLNSYQGWRPAVLIDSTGRQDVVECFTPSSKSEAYHSCSLTWRIEMFTFGGNDDAYQISKLVGYKLLRRGKLSFQFNYGTCTNMAGRKLFFCFDYLNAIGCHWSRRPLGPSEHVPIGSYTHRRIRISSSEGNFIYCRFFNSSRKKLDDILAVGSLESHNKAEIFNDDSNTWTNVPDYPYSGMRKLL